MLLKLQCVETAAGLESRAAVQPAGTCCVHRPTLSALRYDLSNCSSNNLKVKARLYVRSYSAVVSVIDGRVLSLMIVAPILLMAVTAVIQMMCSEANFNQVKYCLTKNRERTATA